MSSADPWSPMSWLNRPAGHQAQYDSAPELARAEARLRELPPLVTSWEIERLKKHLAGAQRGERFLLQGGDCAERFSECRPETITSKLKILLQMSLVLVHAGKMPVIRAGRLAGQYAKPRSNATETRSVNGAPTTLPSYFGDLVNGEAFTPAARRPEPSRLVEGYIHAGMTLNFVRSLLEGGFADVHHPEYWDLGFLKHAGLPQDFRERYERMAASLADALRFMEAIGEQRVEELTRAEFFTSHEALHLRYESAQTRTVPRRDGYYNLTTHLPWIGDRTRALDGAHVEYARGLRNPVGVKIGPSASGDEVIRLLDVLDPSNEPGKTVLIARMGVRNVPSVLPPLVRRVAQEGRAVVWSCDPMHGNSLTTASGIKTRAFPDIARELEESWDVHAAEGSRLGGVHFELTGEDVTECVGGASGVTEADLANNYASACDPRLNYEQAMELAFVLAGKMATSAK